MIMGDNHQVTYSAVIVIWHTIFYILQLVMKTILYYLAFGLLFFPFIQWVSTNFFFIQNSLNFVFRLFFLLFQSLKIGFCLFYLPFNFIEFIILFVDYFLFKSFLVLGFLDISFFSNFCLISIAHMTFLTQFVVD